MAASADSSPSAVSLVDRHEFQETPDGRRDVRYAFAFKNLDWDKYHRHRPEYPKSMYDTWFDYHNKHGGSFEKAHDFASGPGTVATAISNSFSHVFVSDAGAANLATAEASLAPADRFTFRHVPAEQVDTWLPPGSIDLASVGMAMHYMDSDRALLAAAATLKPNGTLAAVTYSFRLRFPGSERLEKLWYDSLNRETRRLIREGKLFPAALKGMSQAFTGLDFVGIPNHLYKDVRRIYINIKPQREEYAFCMVDPGHDTVLLAPSKVENGENKEYVEDSGWSREVDGSWLRGFVASSQMGFDDTSWATEEWKELEEIIAAAPGGKVKVLWPVAVLLATRRGGEEVTII